MNIKFDTHVWCYSANFKVVFIKSKVNDITFYFVMNGL